METESVYPLNVEFRCQKMQLYKKRDGDAQLMIGIIIFSSWKGGGGWD